MTEDFTPAAYRTLLSGLLDRGYRARSYADADTEARDLIVRHDIDMSLEAALPIAEIENALGVKAYYFVLVRTEMYNVFSAAAFKALQRLIDYGHEIGLHLDGSLYDNSADMIQRGAAKECALLESACGTPVRTISFHRPAKQLLGYPENLAGRVHTYQPRYYSQMGYSSDSRGAWHHGHPLNHAAVRDSRALQLLTHPIWWSRHGASPADKAFAFLSERMESLDRELADNCAAHQAGSVLIKPQK